MNCMHKNDILFSIVIPVYNTQNYLSRCLDSVLNQTFMQWECIVIDDGSIDNSRMICDEYSGKDNRIKVIHKKNEGVSIARNIGIKEASGEYILFVDSDDWIERNMLECISNKIHNNHSELLLWGYSIFDGEILTTGNVPELEIIKFDELKLVPEWFNSPWSKAYKRSFLIENKILFPENISLAEDMFFSYICFSKVSYICCIQERLYCYFSNRAESACNTLTSKKIKDEIISIKLLEEVLQDKVRIFKNSIFERKIHAKEKILFVSRIPNIKFYRKTFSEVNQTLWNKKKSLFNFFILYKLDLLALFIFMINKIINKLKKV